jgi:hypothetical protein
MTISRKLGFLPLALNQAGAFIAARGISLTDYLSLYEEQSTKLASKVPAENASVWGYGNVGAFVVWEMSFQALGQSAQELLTLCAFLDNEDIWDKLLPQQDGAF